MSGSRSRRRHGRSWALTGAIAGTTALALGAGAIAMLDSSASATSTVTAGSVDNGYTFLDHMMDKYATGSTTRLVQSYGPDSVMGSFTDSVTYDDALVVNALLARGSSDDLARARIIGDALLYVQANDAAHDGRVRAAYAPTPLTSPGSVKATNATSDVGNMAWVGQALVQLYAKTRDAKYLTGATSIANWVQGKAYDTRGAGGYTGGYDGTSKILWKSTEHNLDLYAFFTMLAQQSGDAAWTTAAAHAKSFVTAMWDASGKKFWVGTDESGVSLNKDFLPEDVNTWAYLALKESAYAASIDWDIKNLAATDGSITGVSFGACDRSKVWLEGTAHLADALAIRNASGDSAKAQSYLKSIQLAQTSSPNHDAYGIVAASHDGLSDCDSDHYYAALHTGATSWYLMAAGPVNPFELLPNGQSTPTTKPTVSANPTATATPTHR
ncbi:hypothetical protein ACIQWL_54935 [Streptomyces mirabilis]|uniref:hypothetical protein n=1 Tax=Streptomyces mirabilis TaxID=68239 RepID=UPI0007660FC7|nr:hypothetical protein [Streptomyces mirabilis]MCX4428980.1 hypothetical protein [Streptomyces mirabilis]